MIFYITLWQYINVKKFLFFLVLYISHGQALEYEKYSYEDLIQIQTTLLNSYSSDSDSSVALSLSQVSYKISEYLFETYTENNDPSLILDAIDSLDIAISIYPENKNYYLLKGDLFYLIKIYDAYYLDAMRAYEYSEDKILESKKSFVSLIDLYINQELYSEAFILIRKMLLSDAQWLLDEFFDMTITVTSQTYNQKIILEDLGKLAKKYTVEIPNIYLAQSYLSLSLNDYDLVKNFYKKYEASKVFSENKNFSTQEDGILNYLNIMAQLNE